MRSMSNIFQTASPAWLLALAVCFASPPADATVMVPLEVADLAAEANRIVRAEVTARYVVPERGPRGEIYTRVDLTVAEYLQGDGPRAITVQQLGGTLGELTMILEGNAPLVPGTEVLAFLDYDEQRELHFVVGLAQGVFVLDRTGPAVTVHRDLDGVSFYTVGARPMAELDQRVTLQEILSLLRPEGPQRGDAQEGRTLR